MSSLTQEIDKIIDSKTQAIVNEIIAAGGHVYLVGGAIRDTALGFLVNDYDFEVYNLTLKQLEQIIKKDNIDYLNEKFGTIKVAKMEFALPRIERKYGESYEEYEIIIDPKLDLKTASKRRDFTINAIMYSMNDKKIEDFYFGLEDLKLRLLKAINYDTFSEDSIRLLRMLKYLFKYDLNLDDQTYELCKKMSTELKNQPLALLHKYFKQILKTKYFNLALFLDLCANLLDLKINRDDYPKIMQGIVLDDEQLTYYSLIVLMMYYNQSGNNLEVLKYLVSKEKDVTFLIQLLTSLNMQVDYNKAKKMWHDKIRIYDHVIKIVKG